MAQHHSPRTLEASENVQVTRAQRASDAKTACRQGRALRDQVGATLRVYLCAPALAADGESQAFDGVETPEQLALSLDTLADYVETTLAALDADTRAACAMVQIDTALVEELRAQATAVRRANATRLETAPRFEFLNTRSACASKSLRMRNRQNSVLALVVLTSVGCREPLPTPEDALADVLISDSPADALVDAQARDASVDAAPRSDVQAPDSGVATDAVLPDATPAVDALSVDAPGEDTPPADASSEDVPSVDVPIVDAPRARSPLSGAHVPSRRPTLRWTLPAGVDGGRVTLCRDRALRVGCVSFDATGNAGAPAADLAFGVWHWNVRGLSGGVAGGAAGPIWRVRVASATLPGERPWGADPDVNGDGLADVIYAVAETSVRVHLGGAEPGSAIVLNAPIDSTHFGAALDFAGDVDGDGYGDLVVGASGSDQVLLYRGSADGPIATPTTVTGPRGSQLGASVAGVSDVNGDGFDDVVALSPASNTVWFFAGSAAGLLAPARIVLGSTIEPAALAPLGDANGDGFADVLLAPATANSRVLLRSAAGLDVARGVTLGINAVSGGDVNGDGFADAAGSQNVVYGATAYPGRSAVLTYENGRRASRSGDFNGDGCDDLLGYNVIFYGTPTGAAGPYPLATGYGTATYVGINAAGDTDGDGYDDALSNDPADATLFLTRGTASGMVFAPLLVTVPDFGDLDPQRQMALVGDINGDHRVDLAANGAIYRGGPAGFSATPTWTYGRPGMAPSYAITVGVGDLNRDGFSDFAYVVTDGSVVGGDWRVRLGSASGPDATDRPLYDPAGSPVCRGNVGALGDVNGDGFDDLSCATWVVLGGAALPRLSGTALPRNVSDARGIGDINHDGLDDLAVQVLDEPSNTRSAGLIYGSTGALRLAATTFPRGSTIVGAGDVNGDGFADAAVIFYPDIHTELRAGSAAGLSSAALRTTTSLSGMIGVGDLNHDGFGDLLLGGAVTFGSPTGPVATTALRGFDNSFVPGLFVAGDVDGDGATDLVQTNRRVVIVQRFTAALPRVFTFTPPSGAPAPGYR